MRRLIEAIPKADWTPSPYGSPTGPWPRRPTSHSRARRTQRRSGAIIRRVRPTAGSQLALFAVYDFHTFTDREGEALEVEADHRRHAEIENAIRDLKYGVGLIHLRSGKFAANGAWLEV